MPQVWADLAQFVTAVCVLVAVAAVDGDATADNVIQRVFCIVFINS
jgi:hypothetical protein